MTWNIPKTDWDTNPTNPAPVDFNRIEGNIAYLYSDIEAKKTLLVNALVAMNRPAALSNTFAELAAMIADISDDANAAVSDVLADKTFYQGGVKKTGTKPNIGAITLTPGASAVAIPAGSHNGSGIVSAVTNLIGANIVEGAIVGGVPGTTFPLPAFTTADIQCDGSENAIDSLNLMASSIKSITTDAMLITFYASNALTITSNSSKPFFIKSRGASTVQAITPYTTNTMSYMLFNPYKIPLAFTGPNADSIYRMYKYID